MRKNLLVLLMLLLIILTGCSNSNKLENVSTIENTTAGSEIESIEETTESELGIQWGLKEDEIEIGVPIKVSINSDKSNYTYEELKDYLSLYGKTYIPISDEEFESAPILEQQSYMSFTEEEFNSISFEELKPYLISYYKLIAQLSRPDLDKDSVKAFVERELSYIYDLKESLKNDEWGNIQSEVFKYVGPKHNFLHMLYMSNSSDNKTSAVEYVLLKDTLKTEDEKYIMSLLELKYPGLFRMIVDSYFIELNSYILIKDMYLNNGFKDTDSKLYMDELLKYAFNPNNAFPIYNVDYNSILSDYYIKIGEESLIETRFYNSETLVISEEDKLKEHSIDLQLPKDEIELSKLSLEGYKSYLLGLEQYNNRSLETIDQSIYRELGAFNTLKRILGSEIIPSEYKSKSVNIMLGKMKTIAELGSGLDYYLNCVSSFILSDVVFDSEKGLDLEKEYLLNLKLADMSIGSYNTFGTSDFLKSNSTMLYLNDILNSNTEESLKLKEILKNNTTQYGKGVFIDYIKSLIEYNGIKN